MKQNKLTYIGHIIEGSNDGGMARNRAFYNELQKRGGNMINVYDANVVKRIKKIISTWSFLLTGRNNTNFIHLGSLFLVFPKQLMRFPLFFKIFGSLFRLICKKNTIYLEINDLPLEQAIDLNLLVEPFYKDFQKKIFSDHPNLHFIFASHKMAEYVVDKYKISKNKVQVLINGAPRLLPKKQKNILQKSTKIKAIYVGTLNRDRGISELLEQKNGINHIDLILVGPEGEWLKNENFPDVHYLGSFPEQEALSIASQCDFGLVPYDEDKFYYNLCYPSKNSFYISAGIPVLCTPLEESLNVLEKHDVFIFQKVENWKNELREVSHLKLSQMKENLIKVKDEFLWENITAKLNLEQ